MSTITPSFVDTLDTKLMHLGASDRVCYQQMRSLARELEGQLNAERQECLEQARLNGMGGEREARLLSQVALLRAALERRHSEQSYHCGYVDEVLRSTAPRA